MTQSYPSTPGFQTHSETSRAAAELLATRETVQNKILTILQRVGAHGQNASELGAKLDKPNSTIGARLRELELEGRVVKTARKRETDMDRDAFIYVHPTHYTDDMGRAPIKGDESKAAMKALLDKIYREGRRRDVNIMDKPMVECVWFMTPEELASFKNLIGRK